MPINEYKRIVDSLENMIADGFQLVLNGKTINWHDTNIVNLISKIKKYKTTFQKLNPGDQIRNKVSKQDMWVINDNGKTVFLVLSHPIVEYPLSDLLVDFEIVKRSDD